MFELLFEAVEPLCIIFHNINNKRNTFGVGYDVAHSYLQTKNVN